MHTLYLGLGANIGNREQTLRQAIIRIGELIGPVNRQSALYETKPWGFDSPHEFLNACICCSTHLTPRQTLAATQKIEKELGRTVKTTDGLYHDRVIDIDILLYDKVIVDEPDLKIPHPFMEQREFVMKPLKEILK
ncbi:MAG TPA: 2-amino-4-hydroxy-6-hydroxymethyldihydropteridine diphosphokinase [Prevotella sp.]